MSALVSSVTEQHQNLSHCLFGLHDNLLSLSLSTCLDMSADIPDSIFVPHNNTTLKRAQTQELFPRPGWQNGGSKFLPPGHAVATYTAQNPPSLKNLG